LRIEPEPNSTVNAFRRCRLQGTAMPLESSRSVPLWVSTPKDFTRWVVRELSLEEPKFISGVLEEIAMRERDLELVRLTP